MWIVLCPKWIVSILRHVVHLASDSVACTVWGVEEAWARLQKTTEGWPLLQRGSGQQPRNFFWKKTSCKILYCGSFLVRKCAAGGLLTVIILVPCNKTDLVMSCGLRWRSERYLILKIVSWLDGSTSTWPVCCTDNLYWICCILNVVELFAYCGLRSHSFTPFDNECLQWSHSHSEWF